MKSLRLSLLLLLLTSGVPMAAADRILVVTATRGFRHASIEPAEKILSMIAKRGSFELVFARSETEMVGMLSTNALREVKAVMFLNTTGELNVPNRANLLDWVREGGAFIGVHSASDTWHEWPEFVAMLGGEFDHHPPEMDAQIVVDDAAHPSTRHLQSPVAVYEEIYFFKSFDHEKVDVLLSLRDGHPLAWTKKFGNGRVFYTALGHRVDVWHMSWFQQHILGAMKWGTAGGGSGQ